MAANSESFENMRMLRSSNALSFVDSRRTIHVNLHYPVKNNHTVENFTFDRNILLPGEPCCHENPVAPAYSTNATGTLKNILSLVAFGNLSSHYSRERLLTNAHFPYQSLLQHFTSIMMPFQNQINTIQYSAHFGLLNLQAQESASTA